MPIVVGGKRFDPNTDKVEKPKQEWSAPVITNDQVVEIDKYIFDKNKTYLVVNGEVKELRKKSAFLMDMILK